MTEQEEFAAFDNEQAEFDAFDSKSGMVDQPMSVPPQPVGNTWQQAGNALAQGVGQGASLGFSDELAGLVGMVTPGTDYVQARDSNRAAVAQAKKDYPIASLFAEVGGSMVPALGAAKFITGLKSAAAMGALEGATYGVGTSEGMPTIPEVAIPAGLGAISAGGSEILSKLLSTTTHPVMSKRVNKADEIKYPLTLGERTNSNTIKKIESALDNYPLGASAHGSLDNRQPILNQAVLDNLGIKTNLDNAVVSTENLNLAKETIGDKFGAFKGEHLDIPIDTSPFNEIFDNASESLTNNKSIQPIISKFLNKTESGMSYMDNAFDPYQQGSKNTSNAVTPEDYMKMRKDLSVKAYSEMNNPSGDRELGKELYQMIDELDKQVLKFDDIDKEIVADLALAKKQWQAYISANKGQAVDRSTGDVNAKSMLSNLSRNSVESGDLVDALLIGKVFPPVGDNKLSTQMGMLQTAGTLTGGAVTGNLLTALLGPPAVGVTLRGLNAANKAVNKSKLLKGEFPNLPIDNLVNILLNQESP